MQISCSACQRKHFEHHMIEYRGTRVPRYSTQHNPRLDSAVSCLFTSRCMT